VGIIHTTGPRMAKRAGKYGPLVPAVRELILRPETPLENDVKDMIAGQFDGALERFAAIGRGRHGDSETSQSSATQPSSAFLHKQPVTESRPGAVGARAPMIVATSPVTAGAANADGQQNREENPRTC
jgi:hypothetical protein